MPVSLGLPIPWLTPKRTPFKVGSRPSNVFLGKYKHVQIYALVSLVYPIGPHYRAGSAASVLLPTDPGDWAPSFLQTQNVPCVNVEAN